MKKQNYIIALLAMMCVSGANASDKLQGEEERNDFEKQYYQRKYDKLINKFDCQCYPERFSWLSRTDRCKNLINRIESINRQLSEYDAEQTKHLSGQRGAAIDYWNKQK